MDCSGSAVAVDLRNDPTAGVPGNCEGNPSATLYQNIGKVSATAAGEVFVTDEDSSHYCNPAEDLPEVIFSNSFEQVSGEE